MSANFMQQGKIECPLCEEEKDSLVVWLRIDGVPFCACDECIESKLPMRPEITKTEAILKVGFRAGYDAARREMQDFLAGKASKG